MTSKNLNKYNIFFVGLREEVKHGSKTWSSRMEFIYQSGTIQQNLSMTVFTVTARRIWKDHPFQDLIKIAGAERNGLWKLNNVVDTWKHQPELRCDHTNIGMLSLSTAVSLQLFRTPLWASFVEMQLLGIFTNYNFHDVYDFLNDESRLVRSLLVTFPSEI